MTKTPTTYIIGHIKPDTDAVVAPMALAYLYKKESCFGYQKPVPVITDPLNPETTFVFDKFQARPPRLITAQDIKRHDQVVLVDHNEETQRLPGLNPNQVVDIVDHHKPNLNLPQPIYLTFKPWGASCTIVSWLMTGLKVEPDQQLASLMLAGILSDTVGFKSATTTDRDIELGKELAKLAQIDDLDKLTLEIFGAKSDTSNLTDQQIVTNDYKVFDFGQKIMVNQLETVEQAKILDEKKQDLLVALENTKTELGVDLVVMAVTDILKLNTKLLVPSQAEAKIAQEAFGGQVKDHVLDIGPKLSRKKEIVPALEKVLT